MIKKVFLIIAVISFGLAQNSLLGLNSWYQVSTLSSAGGVDAVPGADSGVINPAGIALLPQQVHLNLIKYPAGINAQSAILIKSIKKSKLGIGLRHLGYGEFVKIDENGLENGTYSASDVWLSVSFAQNSNNISWGATSGAYLSNLELYSSAALVFSTGFLYDYTKLDLQFGLSIANFGLYITRFTDQKENLPTTIRFCANKGLTHLPLDLNIGIVYNINNKTNAIRLGGIFLLPYNLELTFGINSNNITQQTEYSSIKSIIGSTGVGLNFSHKKYSILFGMYSFGTGGWLYGSGLSFNF